MEAAAAGSLLTDGGRLFSVANPASPPGIATFTEPLVRGGSLVLVAHPDPERLEATYAAERATPRAGDPEPGRLSRPGRSPPSLRRGSAGRRPLPLVPVVEVEVARAGPRARVVAAALARMSLTPISPVEAGDRSLRQAGAG